MQLQWGLRAIKIGSKSRERERETESVCVCVGRERTDEVMMK